jgi:hypothetical protein
MMLMSTTCCNTCYSLRICLVIWWNYLTRSWAYVSSDRKEALKLLSHDYLLANARYCMMSRLLSKRSKKERYCLCLCQSPLPCMQLAGEKQQKCVAHFLWSRGSCLHPLCIGIIWSNYVMWYISMMPIISGFWSLDSHRKDLSKLVWWMFEGSVGYIWYGCIQGLCWDGQPLSVLLLSLLDAWNPANGRLQHYCISTFERASWHYSAPHFALESLQDSKMGPATLLKKKKSLLKATC